MTDAYQAVVILLKRASEGRELSQPILRLEAVLEEGGDSKAASMLAPVPKKLRAARKALLADPTTEQNRGNGVRMLDFDDFDRVMALTEPSTDIIETVSHRCETASDPLGED